MSTTYKGHTFTRTSIGTGPRGACLYDIDGTHGKPAGMRPFLTTVSACREYVTRALQDDWERSTPEGRAFRERYMNA
jgi:hypothetical protein